MRDLTGKLAVVTGASRGIGAATVTGLVSSGARVVGLARSFGNTGSGAENRRNCDITDAPAVERVCAAVVDDFGVPDVVVNCAGSFALARLAATEVSEFSRQIDVNLKGAFFVTRGFLPVMTERGSGHFVTVGSVVDHVTLAGNSAYGAAKRGLRGLHEHLSAELVGTGMRATLVSPGPTDTSLWDPIDPDSREDLPDRASMLRPEDVAEAILWAVSRPPHVAVDVIRIGPGS